jgi:two-component system response regulator HydG
MREPSLTHPLDVFVLTASRCDLDCVVRSGAFRADLQRILSSARVRLASLPESDDRLPDLVRRFATEYRARLAETTVANETSVHPDELDAVRGAGAFMGSQPSSPPPSADRPSRPEAKVSGTLELPFKIAKAQLVRRFERQYLTAILKRYGGNITAAAHAAEVDRVHFLRLLDRHDLRGSKQRSS